MKEISQEEKKRILLELINQIDHLFRKYNIQYSLAYGSLLGAVRHSGFIPWDDDIDIYVKRQDFVKLIHLFEEDSFREDLCNICILEYNGHAKSYHQRFKIADTRTTMLEYGKYRPAVFVDIFPLDRVKEQANCGRSRKKILFIDNLLVLAYSGYDERKGIKGIIMQVLLVLFRIIGRKRIVHILENVLIKSDSNCKNIYIGSAEGGSSDGEFFPINSFDKLINMPFENLSLPCTELYDVVLNSLYGDYMTLPPTSERKIHHYQMFWKD